MLNMYKTDGEYELLISYDLSLHKMNLVMMMYLHEKHEIQMAQKL